MVAPPPTTKTIERVLDFGVDPPGDYAFFGFQLAGGAKRHFQVNHPTLAKVILYLQQIADEARRRRMADPVSAAMEVRETQSNPILRVDLEVDATGASAALQCTTQAGVGQDFQLPYDLVVALRDQLPGLVEEMERRQAKSHAKH